MSDARRQPSPAHLRPTGVSDETVEALGKLFEALEALEALEAVEATRVEAELMGRNVLEGRWRFQTVEEYDDGYYAAFRTLEREARDVLVEGKRHLFEAEMKENRRTHGLLHHEATPPSVE